ncbi:MAG: hypothetical protein NFW04_14300 [Candidatus Accumulibacter sp.]|uniref:hypothetical protein n=1 Tax=Accumulibacter sp. TaxID=2053492 RepID=UPI0025FF077F|nr:hypothetical protein [Accumulibacter sp.]MCM8599803.1 hypothetical protein [Accumulibacter sp.]
MRSIIITVSRRTRWLEFQGRRIRAEELDRKLPFARKPASLREMCLSGEDTIFVTDTIEMTTAEFDAFAADFTVPQPWLAGKGGSVTNGCLCVEVCAPHRPYLYVDPAGGDYARYVARLG